MTVCKIEGCGKKHLGGGYCAMHYFRKRRTGDPNKLVRDTKVKVRMGYNPFVWHGRERGTTKGISVE